MEQETDPNKRDLGEKVSHMERAEAFATGFRKGVNHTSPIGLINVCNSQNYGNPELWDRFDHKLGKVMGGLFGIGIVDFGLLYGGVTLFNMAVEYLL